MTGCPTQDATAQAKSAGARVVLSKPFAIEDLVGAVTGHLPTGPLKADPQVQEIPIG
jgi:DNA-binding response OmpR family regulator